MDAKIRVMLADASAEFRLLLREALEETGEFQVVGETGDGSQVAALAEKYSFTPLHNPYPERGQSESIRIGLAALSDCDAVMFQVADQPRLQKETVADLIGFAAAHPDRIVGLGHRGRRGNPCIFPARFFPELMALTGDCGGRSVILAHEGELLLMEVSSTQLIDIDSPEQLEKL